MPTMPTTPGLTAGSVVDGWKVMHVIDGTAGSYVVQKNDMDVLAAGVASAIADWDINRTYAQGQKCMRNNAFFSSAVNNNKGKDPAVDLSGSWSPFVPGETNSLYFNRAPTNADVYPVGVKWYDSSFGADSPLVMISMGNGVWSYLNEIKLTKIRLNVSGRNTSYRSNLSNVRFYKPDGTLIPNNWLVWGNGSGGIGKGATGSSYNGGTISSNYTSGWAELEVSSLFDTSISIGKILGDFATGGNFMSLGSVEFYYSNGSNKIYSGSGWSTGYDITACNVDPPLACRYGDAVSAAQGELLTAGKLSNPNSNDYGRVSGAAFCSAVNTLLAGLEARIKALEPPPAPKVLSVTIQQGIPAADQATATLSPPDGKDFKFGGLFWMLNRIAPDLAEVRQGSGGTDSVNFVMPTDPGTYMLIMQPTFSDNSTGDVRENFTIT